MRNNVLLLMLSIFMSVQAAAATVAYWRFETGPTGTNVPHGAGTGVWAADIADTSGNGYALSTWETGGGAGYVYRNNTLVKTTIPLTSTANTLCVKNTGGGPAMWTSPTAAIRTITPAQWTIEVSIKLENGGYRTIVGRDSRGTALANQALAALYLQAMPNNVLAIKFCDVTGIWHEALSAANVFQGYTWSSDPDGNLATWYNIAAVSDGTLLSLYLDDVAAGIGYQLIAQTNMTGSSTNTAMTAGAGSGGDWQVGNWTVGRGLYNGGHGDRAYGYIDEVRISNTALTTSEFLFSEDYVDTVAYWRFEEGPADTLVSHGGLSNGQFYPAVPDVSGKGNDLSVWSETLGAHTYRAQVPASPVTLTNAENNFSVQNADSVPGMFTSSAGSSPVLDIETWSPMAFTIEASFNPQSGGYRTIIGREGMNVVSNNTSLSALYLQLQPNNSIAIKYADVAGYWHEAISVSGLVQYDRWYHAAAVCDGQWLKLYLNDVNADLGYQLVAQTDISASGSTDTRLVANTSSGSDWHGGGWTVGRGLFGGVHTDRFLGYIDEVRISRAALDPEEFLFYELRYAGVVTTPADMVVREEGATGQDLFFSLENPPAGNVTLTIQEQNGRGQVTLNQTSLTFTTGNWNIPQSIHVTAVDDTVLENAEQLVPLSIAVSSADPEYNGLNVAPVIVKVADNECGAWGYAQGDFNRDCLVDFHDFVSFAQGWLDCSEPDQAGCANFTGN